MARTSIASYRAATTSFDWTYARVISRDYLMDPQNTNRDWVEVRKWFSGAELKKVSALAEIEVGTAEETRLLDAMSVEAPSGSATRNKKCPFIWFSFMLQSGRSVPSKLGEHWSSKVGPSVGQVQIFSTYDSDCFSQLIRE